MKMLKRVASCAMAAVMSLAMLTACGSSSGSSNKTGEISYSESKLKSLVETLSGDQYTVTTTEDDNTVTVVKSKDDLYVDFSSDDMSYTSICIGDTAYLTNFTYTDNGEKVELIPADSKAAILGSLVDLDASKMKKEFDFGEMMTAEDINNIDKIVAAYEDGYYTEKLTYKDEDGFTKFYFSGDTLKYTVDETGEVNNMSVSKSVDSSVFKLPKTIIETEEELEEYGEKNGWVM